MPRGEQPEFDGLDNSFFENMTKAVFIMGFSRDVVMSKWDGFCEVFEDFDIDKIAGWEEGDILHAVEDTRIIRNMKKIEATVHNARFLKTVIQEFGSVQDYLDSIEEENFEKRLKRISKPFKMMGPKATHLFLWLCHQPVPRH